MQESAPDTCNFDLFRKETLMRKLLLASGMLLVVAGLPAAQPREVIPAKTDGKVVPPEVLQQIYKEVKTPYKYGIVVRGEDKKFVDCPNVFRHGGKWYMMYVCLNKVGYETHLAQSEDLVNWKPLGKILPFPKDGWDKWQADGSIALCDYRWGGSYELEKHDGKYWMSYIGGALQGYEPDPLAIGMAWITDPAAAQEWTRIPENPVLSRAQPDVREFEKTTLYKSQIIHDKAESLGFPFVMYYNGKQKGGYERIGMAVSKDMVYWQRYGAGPVVANGEDKSEGITGDPQIVKIDNVWVMFYFGAFWKPKAFDTFACSYDLVTWTKWEGPHLVEPSEPWDKTYAHKPWVVKHNGVVYHYYCAVGSEGRVIALATSKDLKAGGK
ncbi:MAG: glycosylase [Verrucomicrobia bacterium]|nr:glycosylase [Verrucomicrobiota bacterium]